MSFIRKIFIKKEVNKVDNGKNRIYVEEYDSTYAIVRGVLKIAGLRLMRQDTPLVKKCWNVFYWFCFGNMAFVTVLEMMALVQTIQNKEFGEFFRMMPVIGFMFLAMSKSYKITYRREIFENLISELRNMWPDGELSDEEHNLIKKKMKHFRYAYGSHYMTVTLSLIFSYPPIVIILKTAIGLEAEKMYLPYVYWLPFDPFQSLGVYSVMITIETFHCVTTVWAMMAADLLFCIFLNHITIQLDLLCIRIRKLFYVPIDGQLIHSYPLGLISKESRRINEDEGIASAHERHLADLIGIVKGHQSLISLAGNVEDMFSFALLVNFLNSSLIICFSGLSVIFIEKWSDPNYKAFLISTIIQNWIICWYGQRIIDASTGVVNALYNSGWYKADRRVRSCILIMMHRSQKELHVTTWGFSVISLSTFTSIMKTSWSYFTLLINIMK